MFSLFSSLEMGRKSLEAQQTALQVTSNNIANVNTPGYHRQRAVLESTPSEITTIGPVGTGVTVREVESVRDQFLELRINQSHQSAGRQDTVSSYLDQVEAAFDPNESGIPDALTGLFNSFTALATDATSSSLR